MACERPVHVYSSAIPRVSLQICYTHNQYGLGWVVVVSFRNNEALGEKSGLLSCLMSTIPASITQSPPLPRSTTPKTVTNSARRCCNIQYHDTW